MSYTAALSELVELVYHPPRHTFPDDDHRQLVELVQLVVRDRVDGPVDPDAGWRARAACRGCDPELWFPVVGKNATEPRRICNTCPVKSECRTAGVDENFGIWGGLSPRERRDDRRRLERPQFFRNPTCGSEAGYAKHRRDGTVTCRECRDAHAAHVAWYKQQRRNRAS